jgi:hypothetical protein
MRSQETVLPMDRRRRAIRRLAIAFAVLALGVIALPWLLGADTVQRWLGLALVELAEVATGERVSVGKVRVHPFERRLSVRGLLISSELRGDTILAVRSVEVVVGREGLRPVLDHLIVVEPVLHLHVDDGGLREFQDAVRGDGEGATPWRWARIEDGAVFIDLPSGQIRVEDLDLEPSPDRSRYTLDIESVALDLGRLQQRSAPIHWEGLELALEGQVIPELELHFPMASLHGALSAQRAGDLAGSLWLGLDLAQLDPFVLPSRHLEGMLDVDVELGGSARSPRIGADLSVSPWTLTQAPRGEALGPEQPGRLMSFGAMSGAVSLLLPERALRLDHLEGPFAEGWLSLQGSYGIDEGLAQIQVDLREGSLEAALRSMGAAPTPWVDLSMDVQGQLQGGLKPIDLEGSFAIATTDFHVDDGPARGGRHETILAIPHGTLQGRIAIEPRRVRAQVERLELPRGGGYGTVEIGLDSRGPLDVRLSLRRSDLSIFQPLGSLGLRGRGDVDAHIHGPFDGLSVQGEASVRGLEVLGIPFADSAEMELRSPNLRELHLRDLEARRGRTRYAGNLGIFFGEQLSLDTQILVRDGYLTDLMGMFVDIPGIEARLDGTLDLRGEPFHLDGAVELELEDIELVGEGFAAGRASARMDDGIFTLRFLEVQRRGEAESLLLRGSVGREYAANFELLSDGLRLEHLDALQGRELPLEGRLQLLAYASGSLMEPRFQGRVGLAGVRSHEQPVPPSVLHFDSAGSVVSVDGELVGGAGELSGQVDWSSAAYRFELDLLELPVHLARPTAAAGSSVELWADGGAVVQGEGSRAPDVDVELDRVQLVWGTRRLTNQAPWRFVRRGPWWQLEDIALSGSDSWLRIEGEKLPDRSLALEGEGVLELDWLRLVSPDILRAGGRARWDLSVVGVAGAPEVEVRASLQEGLLRTSWFPHSFEALEGELSFGPRGYQLRDVKGRVGGGEVAVGGTIHARDWRPESYDLQGSLEDARVKYIDSLPPVVGDARLSFDGPLDALVLAGEIDVREIVFSDRIDWEGWLIEQERLSGAAAEQSADIFSMDIGIRADGTGRIRNNVGNARLSADLRVVGDTARPGVLGKVWAEDEGRVYLQEREFSITRGELHFIDPYSFDPELDFLFETDVRSRVRDYHIFYRITGPFSDWRTDASSDPALSQADINWLLLFGATRAELEEFGELEGALAWEGIDLLSKELGSGELLDRFGAGLLTLDRIDIITGTTTQGVRNVSSEPRLLAEKDFGEPWDLTLAGEMNVTRPEDFYLSVEKRVAQHLYLTTYYASIQYERSLDLGGAFGSELQLRWEVE